MNVAYTTISWISYFFHKDPSTSPSVLRIAGSLPESQNAYGEHFRYSTWIIENHSTISYSAEYNYFSEYRKLTSDGPHDVVHMAYNKILTLPYLGKFLLAFR